MTSAHAPAARAHRPGRARHHRGMSSTERAAWLAEHLLERLPTEEQRLELALRASIPMAELRGMLAGALLPCPRTMGRLAAALNTTPAALLSEPADA